ncbi:transcription initiation factor TFIID subunit A-domain-containing protein [Aspergillus novoparasiticus]|uniref:Transcription initiation factor TFIID subunit A-domain-containing protein n=1 Tax=Aspergillus novoparasiticus TaxID=986946 RepID=A0A5N6EJE3_9EURO|nr:transcription initiation factor TFIID subunit A-domain-containing protein [Aspergillus novoparasiticus]
MDGSQVPAAQPMVTQHSNLIRTDQVQKLPHLTEQQKSQHTQLVRNFWEVLNNRDPQSTEYQHAHSRLTQISQSLMKGMRAFQQNRQLQQQQLQGQPGQPGQRPQSVNPQTFNQLLPQIQQKVNSLQFSLPPNISQEQAQSWLPEARLRYGIALQKQEIGRARVAELRQQFSQRQAAGNMTQEELQEFKNRQLAAEKLYREGGDFLTKFKEQQENFKAQQQRAGVQNVTGQPQGATVTPAPTVPAGSDGRPANTPVSMHPGQAPTPAPHTITSAVSAARSQAGQTAMSPSVSQQGQVPVAQAAPVATPAAPAAPPVVPPQAQSQPQPQSQPQQHPQPPPQAQSQPGAPGSQVTFTQVPNLDGSTPTPTSAQPVNVQGPPRPLSQQAAMAQAAQNYTNNNANNNMGQQQNMPQPATNSHAHPQGYIPNRATDNTARNINMAIPKTLNVPPPEPVTMAPARPTLSGGPSHGAMGMMGQPAIQKHPGYVLEGEGQRVLSKKMLDILVRQVTGGGEGEGLTPDAEEFILQMADDFVDDVITAACRLAKLRPSSTLEIRDIQLVLERNYNMRISGFSTDDLRTVKKPQPTQGWTQKMSAIQAAKVTQGKAE